MGTESEELKGWGGTPGELEAMRAEGWKGTPEQLDTVKAAGEFADNILDLLDTLNVKLEEELKVETQQKAVIPDTIGMSGLEILLGVVFWSFVVVGICKWATKKKSKSTK